MRELQAKQRTAADRHEKEMMAKKPENETWFVYLEEKLHEMDRGFEMVLVVMVVLVDDEVMTCF